MPDSNKNRPKPKRRKRQKKDDEQQVSLAQQAGAKNIQPSEVSSDKKSKKKRSPFATTVISLVLVAIMIVSIVVLVVGIRYLYTSYVETEDEVVKNVDKEPYTTTDSNISEKVQYYLLGIMGKDDKAPLETLSLICYDIEKNALDIMEIPKNFYIGEYKEVWKTSRIDEVWTNPMPVNWCDNKSCRKAVKAEEIKDKKHTVCGTEIKQKKGSPSGDLGKVFNLQFGIPIDAHFIIPQDGLVKLVNYLDGVYLNIEKDVSIKDITYRKGVQIVTGDAALYYCLTRDGVSDIDRILQKRQVFMAIMQQLINQDENQHADISVGELQAGKTPIKSNIKRKDMSDILVSMKSVKAENINAYVIPGYSAKSGKNSYYSINKEEFLKLLNDRFLPYSKKKNIDDISALIEIGKPGKVNIHHQQLSEVVLEENNK